MNNRAEKSKDRSHKDSVGRPNVPQFYFDLIARLVPGTILLLLISVSHLETLQLTINHVPKDIGISIISGLILFVVAGFLAYGIAITMWGIWFLSVSIILLLVSWFTDCDKIDPETLANCGADEFATAYEIIKKKDPSAGTRLTKLKAELHLSATLLIGTILLFFYHLSNDRNYSIAVIAIIGLIGVVLHVRTRINGVINSHPDSPSQTRIRNGDADT